MRALLDAAHPVDVWTFAALEDCLLEDGYETLWLSRPGKEHVVDLIEARGRPHVAGPPAGAGRIGLARELLQRDLACWRTVRDFRPDAIFTRSPAGVHAGCLTRTPVVYDSDDGRAAGLLYWAAAPFADLVTGPEALGRIDQAASQARCPRPRSKCRHLYRGYKELLYLHPSRFEPDPRIRAEIGCEPHERLFLLRLSAFASVHDRGEAGLCRPLTDAVVERLSLHGRMLLSCEAEPPEGLADLVVRVEPQRFHHLLAACDLVVGDSQTVTAEAAVLGTPSIRFSSWAGRHAYLLELEQRWQLAASFGPYEEAGFLAALDTALNDIDATAVEHRRRREAMLEWCDDPDGLMAAWISFAQRCSLGYASSS